MEKVESKTLALEEFYEHLHEMKREDLDPTTNTEDMTESADFSSTEKCGEAEDTLTVHKAASGRLRRSCLSS